MASGMWQIGPARSAIDPPNVRVDPSSEWRVGRRPQRQMAQNGLSTLDGARFRTDVSGTRTDDGWMARSQNVRMDPMAQTPGEPKGPDGTDAKVRKDSLAQTPESEKGLVGTDAKRTRWHSP